MFIGILFIVVSNWKHLKHPSVREWINKFVICLCDRILPSKKKKKKITATCNKKTLSEKYYTERSKTQKCTYCMIPYT